MTDPADLVAPGFSSEVLDFAGARDLLKAFSDERFREALWSEFVSTHGIAETYMGRDILTYLETGK